MKHYTMLANVMTAPDLLQRFKNITVWNRGGVRAPHKPLLLLWALGRAAQKKPRLTKFAVVEQPLRQLLMDFGPRRKSYHPEYPFWYLRSKNNSKIWEVERAGELPLKKNHREPQIEELREASGGFLSEVFLLLEHDSSLIGQLAFELVNANFPSSIHSEILEAVGLHPLEHRTKSVALNGDFASVVLQAYEYRCAVCGHQSLPTHEQVGLEATHIKWPQAGGPDSIANGLCLCVMHRKAFDRGVLGISELRSVLVCEQARRSKGLDSWLVTYADQPIQMPKRSDWQPNPDFLAWHTREVFQGFRKPPGKGN